MSEQSTEPTGQDGDATPRRRWRAGTRARRRFGGFLALGLALVAMGTLYATLAPGGDNVARAQDTSLVREGGQLYDNACITCHGSNLQGVEGRGPSLVGVGEASVYFQVSTGRMPLKVQGAQAARHRPEFDPQQTDALGAYVQANGGGPQVPQADGAALVGSDLGRGGELFRLNCAQCHNFTGRGGALSSGKFAPVLDAANPSQVYAAMLVGPGNMPTFADTQLTPQEKQDIIGYVESVGADNTNPGGAGLGGFGPVPEGLVAFLVGLAGLIGFALWIGSRQ